MAMIMLILWKTCIRPKSQRNKL